MPRLRMLRSRGFSASSPQTAPQAYSVEMFLKLAIEVVDIGDGAVDIVVAQHLAPHRHAAIVQCLVHRKASPDIRLCRRMLTEDCRFRPFFAHEGSHRRRRHLRAFARAQSQAARHRGLRLRARARDQGARRRHHAAAARHARVRRAGPRRRIARRRYREPRKLFLQSLRPAHLQGAARQIRRLPVSRSRHPSRPAAHDPVRGRAPSGSGAAAIVTDHDCIGVEQDDSGVTIHFGGRERRARRCGRSPATASIRRCASNSIPTTRLPLPASIPGAG